MADSTQIGAFKQEPPKVSEGKAAVQKFMGMNVPSQPQAAQANTAQGDVPEVSAEPQIEAEIEQRLISEIRKIDAAPELSYEQRLARLGVTLEEAAKMVDAILANGFYEREFPINQKHSVTLRTRDVTDQERLQESVEHQIPRYALTVNEMTARYNLAASLAEFNKNKFGPDDFKKAYEYLGKVPLPVFNALITRLAHFDQLMFTALSEGAVENF